MLLLFQFFQFEFGSEMLKLFLSFFVFCVAAVWTFDHVEFQKKHCYYYNNVEPNLVHSISDDNAVDRIQSGYICENFVLTKADLDGMARNQFVLSRQMFIFLRNCSIDYFNENLVSIFPGVYGLFFDNCVLSLKDPGVSSKQTLSEYFYHLSFYNCDIRDNLNSKALQKFTGLSHFYFKNSNFQYRQIDEHLLPKEHDYPIIVWLENVNVECIHRDVLSDSRVKFFNTSLPACQLDKLRASSTLS